MCHMAIGAHRKRKDRECIGNHGTYLYIYIYTRGLLCRRRRRRRRHRVSGASARAPRTGICTRRGPVQRSAPHLPRRRERETIKSRARAGEGETDERGRICPWPPRVPAFLYLKNIYALHAEHGGTRVPASCYRARHLSLPPFVLRQQPR